MAVSLRPAGLVSSIALILSVVLDLASGKMVVCYATNWPQYRPAPGTFHMSDVDPSMCTHLVFAFAKVTGNRLDNYEENDVGSNGQYRQFTGMKRRYPNLKFMLGVGGWSHGGDPFSQMARTQAGRAEFIRTTVDYLRQYEFDGLDIDWEYPKAEDKRNLVSLLQGMRQAFDRESASGRPLTLAMSVAAGLQNAIPAYDVPALNRYLDFISVMTYDYHGAWENNTGHLAPLMAPNGDDFSVTASMHWWTSQGASRDKLNLGLALYGRTWTLANPGDSDIGAQATGPGPVGRFTREDGVLSHAEVCERIQNGFRTVFHQMGQMSYSYSAREWITYEDVQSINIKLQFLLDNDFAGAMIWSFDQDDWNGQYCNQGRYPMMSTISRRLLNVGPSRPAAGNPPGQSEPAWQQPPYRPQQNPTQQYRPQQNPTQQYRPQQNPPQRYRPQQNPTQQYRPQQNPTQQYRPQQNPTQQYRPQQNPPPYQQNPPPYQQNPPPYQPQQNLPQYRPQQYPQPNPQRIPPRAPPQQYSPPVSPQDVARQEPPLVCPTVPSLSPQGSEVFVAGHNFNCPSSNGKFADDASCQYYYFCLFGMPFRERCPRFSHFNPATQDCECIVGSNYRCPY